MFAINSDNKTNKINKHPLVAGCLLLGLATIPDVMVVPVLKELTVDRFGISEGDAHYFMAVNLLGALLAIGVLAVLNRAVSSTVLLLGSAIISSVLMAAMAVTTSWGAFLTLRCLEGGADLMLLAIPLRIIASAGGKERFAGRMGGGFTVMMVGMAIGVVAGGKIGSNDPTMVLWAGAATMLLITLIVAFLRKTIDNVPASPRPEPKNCPLLPKEWIGAGFLALDRGLAALVSTTLPILLASGFAIGSVTLGVALGGMFLALAVFAAPFGILADRCGGGKIRLVASVLCGGSLACLGLLIWLPPVVILPPCLLLYGVGAAGSLPSAFSVAVRQEASNLVFSSLQAAGQAGYAFGVLGGMVLVSVISLPPATLLTVMFPIAGLLFIILNVLLLVGIRTLEMRVP
jgi:MFS family permease